MNKSPNLIRDYQQVSVSSGGPASKFQLNSITPFYCSRARMLQLWHNIIHMVGLKSNDVNAETSSGRNKSVSVPK